MYVELTEERKVVKRYNTMVQCIMQCLINCYIPLQWPLGGTDIRSETRRCLAFFPVEVSK